MGSYLVDIFRARGGERRGYVFHGPGNTYKVEGLSLAPFQSDAASGDEFPLENVQTATGEAPWSILLAKNGMASFCYDPIEQGERYQLLDDGGKPLVGGTTAHSLVGVGSTLLGRNTATFRVWDGMRAIDDLQSRQEIDPQRIGCTGNSGGGTLTSYLMALDPRIVCAAPSGYLCGFRRLCETIGPQDAEQNIHGQIALGMDHADYILARAPKPTPHVYSHTRFLRHRRRVELLPPSQAFLYATGLSPKGSTWRKPMPNTDSLQSCELPLYAGCGDGYWMSTTPSQSPNSPWPATNNCNARHTVKLCFWTAHEARTT